MSIQYWGPAGGCVDMLEVGLMVPRMTRVWKMEVPMA